MSGLQQLETVRDVRADVRQFAGLNDLIDDVFGVSFASWDEAGFWDPRYVPTTLFDDEVAVANASIYSLDMVIDGRPCRVAQVCTCATREGWRDQGLGSGLLGDAIARARTDHDLVFVMSTNRAIPFYLRQGFEPVLEQIPTLRTGRVRPKLGLIKLDIENSDDLELISQIAGQRSPVSRLCGVLSLGLFMFHVLNVLPGCLYYCADLSCLVLMKRRGKRLRVFDIVTPKTPRFSELHPYLSEGRRDLVEFRFLPDQLGVSGLRWRRSRENNLHILPGSASALDMRRVLIPFTAQA